MGNMVLLLAVLGLLLLRVLALVIKVPLAYLVPSVLALCAWGGFGITGSVAGPLTVFVFAGLGWLMRKHQYPVPAIVIGLILGQMLEGELVRTLQISSGNFSYLLERPIALVIFALLLLSAVILPLYKKFKGQTQ